MDTVTTDKTETDTVRLLYNIALIADTVLMCCALLRIGYDAGWEERGKCDS